MIHRPAWLARLLSETVSLAEKVEPTSRYRSLIDQLSEALLERAGYDFSLRPAPLDRLAKMFRIRFLPPEVSAFPAVLRMNRGRWEVRFSLGQSYARKRFSLAHEIGHIVWEAVRQLHDLELKVKEFALEAGVRPLKEAIKAKEKGSESSQRIYEHAWIERFCNELAAALLIHPRVIQGLRVEDLMRMDDLGHPGSAAHPDDCPLLRAMMLEDLATRLEVSLTTLTRSLHKSAVLAELKSGILISSFKSNPTSGKRPALRIDYSSTPDRIFIARHQKVKVVGLQSALWAFDNLKFGKRWHTLDKIVIHDLWLPYNQRSRTLATVVEHSLYPAGRSKMLLTCFCTDQLNSCS